MTMYLKNNQPPTRGSFRLLGGRRIISLSGGLNDNAVAGKPSRISNIQEVLIPVTRLTHNNCTGIKASGIPNSTVKNIDTTSPIFELIKYRINCCVLLYIARPSSTASS